MNELIEKFGQVAWEAAVRQVQLDIWFDTAGGIAILGIAIGAFFVLKLVGKESDAPPVLLEIVIVLCIALLSVIPFASALKQSLNPEFYAIEKFIPGKK